MGASNRTLRDRPARPGIRTSVVAGTVMMAIAHGVSMDRISAATGLNAEDLSDPDGWLPEAVVPTVWRLLADACPSRAITLDVAAAAPPDLFGPLLYVIRYSDSLRSALQAFVRYRFVLSDNLHLALEETPAEARLSLSHPNDALDGGYAAEMGLAMGARLGREFSLHHSGPLRVEFSHPALGPTERYREFFQAPVHFERPHNLVAFRLEDLACPPRNPDPRLFRFIEQNLDRAQQRLAEERNKPHQLARVREAAWSNARRSEYSATALARKLGMSLRKLQRLVREHGAGVRTLIEEAREANARQLLGDRRLSVEEVSFLLGYADDRAFRRAFKRWTGQTPALFRRALLPAATTAAAMGQP